MDTVKAQVAKAVRDSVTSQAIKTIESELDKIIGIRPPYVETQVVTDLQTVIRVRTDAGPRYFLVQVKEQI